MKSKLLTILIPLMALFSNCNKEDYFGNFSDLNGNGTLDQINGIYTPKGYCIYYFDNGSLDTNYIAKGLKSRPANPTTFDFERDDFPDVIYEVYKGDKCERFVVNNVNGNFEEPKKKE